MEHHVHSFFAAPRRHCVIASHEKRVSETIDDMGGGAAPAFISSNDRN